MQDFILFGFMILAMFACGYIPKRPVAKGLAPPEKRVAACVLAAVIIAVLIDPVVLTPLMAGWLITGGAIASMVGVFGPTTIKAIRYGFEGAYGIKKSNGK